MNDAVSSLFSVLVELVIWVMRKWADITSRVRPADPSALDRLQQSVEQDPRFNDPVYKENLQRLIERNRRFEDNKE
ncbi:MAG: hypothetical protein AB7I42_09950 [Bradyrhizobium sp.]|uniref:hypothetical protein n=1 Tax=Bradyrhizobium sp. TaxID=376 RepID=UPI003D12C38D